MRACVLQVVFAREGLSGAPSKSHPPSTHHTTRTPSTPARTRTLPFRSALQVAEAVGAADPSPLNRRLRCQAEEAAFRRHRDAAPSPPGPATPPAPNAPSTPSPHEAAFDPADAPPTLARLDRPEG
jgi:hypothetical protein